MKSVQIMSSFWSEFDKMWTRKNSIFVHFSRSVMDIVPLLSWKNAVYFERSFSCHVKPGLHFFLSQCFFTDISEVYGNNSETFLKSFRIRFLFWIFFFVISYSFPLLHCCSEILNSHKTSNSDIS